ncbi:MAG: beta-ketoacyl synthase chain length factor [Pseudomonas sp.]
MIHFSIDQWSAWAPGLEHQDAWRAWCGQPHAVVDNLDAQPDVSFLPAMQRRRLSRLARMAFHVAWPLADAHGPLPMVFVSRHGETPRTLAILSDLAHDEPLSPTQFSLSVHNAIIGLWSIQRGDTSEMTALAAEGDGLEHGLLEAATLLGEGAPAVLLVVAEELPPALYSAYIDDVPFAYAVALLLTPGSDWQLQLTQGNGPRATWPHALNLVRALCAEQPYLQHHWKNRQWNWSRSTA